MTRHTTRRAFMSSAAAIPLLRGAGTWAIGLGSLISGAASSQPVGEDQAERRVTLLHFTDIHRYVPLRVKSATSASAFPTDYRPWLPEVVPRFLATMAAPTPVEGIDGPFTLSSLDGPPTFMLVDSNGVV